MKTKKLVLFISSLCLIFLSVTQHGCKKDEEQPPEESEIVISDNTVVIDTTVLTDLVVTGTTYTYNITGGQPDIITGDILIGESNGGYLRKVKSVSFEGDEVQIETEDAKITDAILNGDFQQNLQIQMSSKKVGDLRCETYLVSKTKGVRVKGNVIDLDGIVLYDSNVGGVDVELTLPEGSISFEPDIDFGFKIRNGAFKELHAYVEGDIDMSFKALLEASGEFSATDEVNLATFKTFAVQFIGGVPIVEVFTLSFYAGFSTNNYIHGDVETGFNSDYSLKYGYLYTKENGWQQIWDKSAGFQHYPVQGVFNANLGLEVYIKPSLTIEFYGVAGPGMDVRPYLDFIANAHNKDIYWNWELIGGIDGHLLFNAHIFGWQIINYSKELFDWNKVIASDNGVISGNQPPNASFTVNPNSGTTNTVFSFDASGCTDNEDPTSDLQVRWDWENDGNWDTNWETDKIENHQYSGEGTYTVKMEVKDTEGLTDNVTQDVIVSNVGGGGEPCPGIPTITYGGQVYNTVQIGDQCWMKENLNIGTMINGSEEMEDNGIVEKYCYNNDPANCEIYGGLYQWGELMQYLTNERTQGICPDGWHIPSNDEWVLLADFLGGLDIAGGKMKEVGTTHWYTPNTGATNECEFTALPGGGWGYDGSFNKMSRFAYFFSSSRDNYGNPIYQLLSYNNEKVKPNSTYLPTGNSVRCLRD